MSFNFLPCTAHKREYWDGLPPARRPTHDLPSIGARFEASERIGFVALWQGPVSGNLKLCCFRRFCDHQEAYIPIGVAKMTFGNRLSSGNFTFIN